MTLFVASLASTGGTPALLAVFVFWGASNSAMLGYHAFQQR